MRLAIKGLFLFLSAAMLVACHDVPTFTVSGSLAHAEGKTLYLEHTALMKMSVLDSCVLDAEGMFAFEAPAPEYPDFYRLRVGAVSLPLAIDSTENVEIITTLDSLSQTLSIKGSVATLQIAELRAVARVGSRDVLREAAQKVIVANPRSLSAYYAVFMKQGGAYVWDMYDASDRRMYQAVATSFQTWMPEYDRTKTLCGQVRDAMYAARSAQQQQAVLKMIDDAENAFLDICLKDEKGAERSLADLRGKVVILDFSAIEMEQSMGYVFELRELYNRYSKSGLEIYSVSLDRNKLLWEDGVANLPWVNVYAGDKAAEVLTRYNVQSLPTLFLLDRKGNVQGRYIGFEQLGTDLRKYF